MDNNYLAFDIGGTSIKYGIIDQHLQVVDYGTAPTNNNEDNTIVKTLIDVTEQKKKKFNLRGIGISTAGRVGKRGEIIYAGPTVKDYQGTQLKQILETAFAIPVKVINDVDAALMGEIFKGNLDRQKSIYCIALGTGIGGAFYYDGKLLNGAHGLANSVGYLNFQQIGDSSFEAKSSTLAFERQLVQYDVTVPEAFSAARAGEKFYLSLINQWCEALAKEIANICLLLDPDIFLIGGAVSRQGAFFTDKIKYYVNEKMPDGMFQTELKIATLQDLSQLFGAVSLFYAGPESACK
ncbi:ROK family protein [Limosilactobacillus antri]|uniref:ROK family protein n=1 Tax=Limosilactobacillus antri TaxID=227943 RepID=UPI001F57A489|nr:ROK family protein [Limosilactobacillus antri]